MTKIKTIAFENASERAQETMELIRKKMGRIPNMYQVMANSPAVLESYVKLNISLSSGTLDKKMGELIAMATAEHNTCSYCLSAHDFLGKKVGLSENQLTDGRNFHSEDEKMNQGLLFAKKILETPKKISNADIEPLKEVGYSDGEILEIVGNVIRNIFTNYINIISETPIDWPNLITPQKNN